MKKFRIAVLGLERGSRPDCHAYHFAPFMDDCDPLILREIYPGIHYWFTDSNNPDKLLNIEKVDGFEIVKVWDAQNAERATDFARMMRGKPKVCRKVEETWDGIDAAFIADGSGDGSEHLSVVAPFLERRIPVFVDKPFAFTYADAKAMIGLAKTNQTPLLSASLLSHVDEVKHFQNRLQEIPPPGLGIVKGVGHYQNLRKPSYGAIIHGLALAQAMFGTGVLGVESMGIVPLEIGVLHYPNDLRVMVLNTHADTYDWFSCEVWGKVKRRIPPPPMYLRSRDIGDPDFLKATTRVLRLFKRMLETKKPPIPYETHLELVAILEAGRAAHSNRQRVELNDIRS